MGVSGGDKGGGRGSFLIERPQVTRDNNHHCLQHQDVTAWSSAEQQDIRGTRKFRPNDNGGAHARSPAHSRVHTLNPANQKEIARA